MEATCLQNNALGGIPGIQKGESNPVIMPMTGSVMRRKRLSDITNLTSNGRMSRSDVANGQENAKAAPSMSSKDYMSHLLKENATLMMLLGERNKMVELGAIEMQKLRFALQNSNQQNQQLARFNSQMLAEHNLDKDRLKALNHELGCTAAVLRAKNLELEEKKKLIKELREMTGAEEITEGIAKLDNVAADAPIPDSHKKACVPNRKRTLRNRSLGSATLTHQVTAKEKDENRRKSLRRGSSNLKSELNVPTEDLFEIDDVEFRTHSLANDPMHEQSSHRLDSSSESSASIAGPKNSLKEEQKDQNGSPQNQNKEVRRTSIGRPMRRAAEKVSSYKEVPLNTKMRRDA